MFRGGRQQPQQRQSPNRSGQGVGHLEETPPVQRKLREVRVPNNENRDVSNFHLPRREYCEFVCREDYKNSFECDDIVKHSMNIQQLSHSQDNFLKLTHSQENILRRPVVNDKVYGGQPSNCQPMNKSLTFGSMKPIMLKNSLGVNKEFLEEKKMKNEILDEIIRNASKQNFKSQDFTKRTSRGQVGQNCVNHEGKKGKYRIIGEEDDGNAYCSKCSISLLQQGVSVEEITAPRKPDFTKQRKELESLIAKVGKQQTKLKIQLDAMQEEECNYDFQGARNWLEEAYEIIAFTVEQMKCRDFESLQTMESETHAKNEKQQSRLQDKLGRLESIRSDLNQLVQSDLSQLSESQLSAAFQSYSSSIKAIESHEPDSFCIKIETIDEKLTRLVSEVKQNFDNRSESQIKEESSIISRLDEKLSEVPRERNPFRNLFTEDESSNQQKAYSKTQEPEEIMDVSRFSPKFRKLY